MNGNFFGEVAMGWDKVDQSAGEEKDELFLMAESLSTNFSLFPDDQNAIEHHISGLILPSEIKKRLLALSDLDVDAYIESVVLPSEDPARKSAPEVIRGIAEDIADEQLEGPFYSAVITLNFGLRLREVGVIAQNRSARNGVWLPEHHRMASYWIERFSRRSIPVVCFLDTPGADAEEKANSDNQAHAISYLIAEMSHLDVPNLGVIFGLGYSGGAIPLAASNLLLSVRDGVFNTIQPKGLSSIARRLNFSWQECAKYVGISSYQLYEQGCIDGIIDYSPLDDKHRINLTRAIVTGISSVENGTTDFVKCNPYILQHYRRSVMRYISPSKTIQKMQTSESLSLTRSPTEYSNVFGVAYRYLRYLAMRCRIKCTTVSQYGRLARYVAPSGELQKRAALEKKRLFLSWFQDSEKLIYEESIAKAWKNYRDKKTSVHDERGSIAQFIFGDPAKNFERSRNDLIFVLSVYLHHRWKADAVGNFLELRSCLTNVKQVELLFRVSDFEKPRALIKQLKDSQDALALQLRTLFSFEGKKLFDNRWIEKKSDIYLQRQLATEFNTLIGQVDSFDVRLLLDENSVDKKVFGEIQAMQKQELEPEEVVALNRSVLVQYFSGKIATSLYKVCDQFKQMTLIDVLLDESLKQYFVEALEFLVQFDVLFDQCILNLNDIAKEAHKTHSFSKKSLQAFLDKAFEVIDKTIQLTGESAGSNSSQETFLRYYLRFFDSKKRADYLKKIEAWKQHAFPHLSDPLLVIVTCLFDRLLPSFIQAKFESKRYDNRVLPRFIGRRKNFWYQLTVAYQDLLINELIAKSKKAHKITVEEVIKRYTTHFEELNKDLITSDPVQFPGFRLSIENALKNAIVPCGVVTGIGTLKIKGRSISAGLVISNIPFQAGAFDMASAVKFCKLMVECSKRKLPIICFVSSGGMQTKEGACALFSMAVVNDRITRFIRDKNLPIIVFGFGDCTGGAQASFVTHPLVQTYYFSGTNMPFAGQIVVPAHLPCRSTLSNYLSSVDGSMQGLVKHPFWNEIDDKLSKIDPEIPLPIESVEEVIGRVMKGRFDAKLPKSAPSSQEVKDIIFAPVKKVLIHARGCTAVKLIRIAKQEKLRIVLVQSDPDMHSLPAELLNKKDQVICIGGNTSDESYLNAMSVLRIAQHESVDALHPGIGFLSENPHFAEICRSHGINFIGPTVSSMEAMGNKSNAIKTAMHVGVSVVPGSHGVVPNIESAINIAKDIGYPLLIKAVHGGGGKGIRIVESEEHFQSEFMRVSTEARNAFGNGDLYLEKYIKSLRHIEVQVLRDKLGNTLIVGLRDCSVQRDKQKIIEESECVCITEELKEAAYDYSRKLANEVGYIGAGTVEFIFDLDNQQIYFMEMNARLQVEHPVTEKVSGVDIVSQQFRIASGESIEHVEVLEDGHAIEVRINAERLQLHSDGEVHFRPDPGKVTHCLFPREENIDVITMIDSGRSIPPYYDSLVAQIIVKGKDRIDAIDRMIAYLDKVEVEGISTNIVLVKHILNDKVFRTENYNTSFLSSFWERIDVKELIRETESFAKLAEQGILAESISIENSSELKVLAPSAGIFYSTPTPVDPDYVNVGDEIGIATVICQLEAMKLFTPLALDDFNEPTQKLYEDGKYEVVRVNVSNGQQVNAGDLLFVIRPVGK